MPRSRKVDGKKVKRARDRLWLTQQELGEKTGLTNQAIHRIETGKAPYPRRYTIFALAKAFGVRPEELLEDDA